METYSMVYFCIIVIFIVSFLAFLTSCLVMSNGMFRDTFSSIIPVREDRNLDFTQYTGKEKSEPAVDYLYSNKGPIRPAYIKAAAEFNKKYEVLRMSKTVDVTVTEKGTDGNTFKDYSADAIKSIRMLPNYTERRLYRTLLVSGNEAPDYIYCGSENNKTYIGFLKKKTITDFYVEDFVSNFIDVTVFIWRHSGKTGSIMFGHDFIVFIVVNDDKSIIQKSCIEVLGKKASYTTKAFQSAAYNFYSAFYS